MKATFNPWPHGIMLFFALLIGALATVVFIAATHRENLVSEDYYEQELKYQDRIDAAARARQSGAAIQVEGGRILVSAPAAQLGQSLTGQVSFYRANAPELDRAFAFKPGADGTEIFDATNFAAGGWRVRVAWRAGAQDYFLEQKIVF